MKEQAFYRLWKGKRGEKLLLPGKNEAEVFLLSERLKSDDPRSRSLPSNANEKFGLRKHCTRIITHARKSLTT